MEDRSKFDWMLDWSHVAAAAFKSIFGYVCFLTFQSDTQEVGDLKTVAGEWGRETRLRCLLQ